MWILAPLWSLTHTLPPGREQRLHQAEPAYHTRIPIRSLASRTTKSSSLLLARRSAAERPIKSCNLASKLSTSKRTNIYLRSQHLGWQPEKHRPFGVRIEDYPTKVKCQCSQNSCYQNPINSGFRLYSMNPKVFFTVMAFLQLNKVNLMSSFTRPEPPHHTSVSFGMSTTFP